MSANLKNKILTIIPLIASALVFSSLLTTYFWRDDFLHLYQIANTSFIDFLFNPYGGHLYLTRNAIFYISYKLFGMNATPYFIIVLAVHIFNVYLLFNIINYLIEDVEIASIGSTIWGIALVNYGSLGWYSAFGHVLTATFFLLLLIDLVQLHIGSRKFSPCMLIRWNLLIFAAATSYGVGFILILTFPIMVWFIVNNTTIRKKIIFYIFPIIIITLVLYIFKMDIYLAFSHTPLLLLDAPTSLPITETYNLEYLMFHIKMLTGALSFCISSIWIALLKGILSSTKIIYLSYFIAFVFIIIVAYFYYKSSNLVRKRYIAFMIPIIAVYTTITLGRAPVFHVFNVPSHDAAITFRYHYVTVQLLVIIMSLIIYNFKYLTSAWFRRLTILLLSFIMISLYPNWKFAPLSDIVNTANKERLLYELTISHIDKEIKNYPGKGDIFLNNTMADSFSIFKPLDTDFPGRAAIFIIGYPNNSIQGRKIFFIEKNVETVKKIRLKKNWRIADILIAEYEAEKLIKNQKF